MINLTRAAPGSLASVFHARASAGTIRAHLITIPGRLACSAPTVAEIADSGARTATA